MKKEKAAIAAGFLSELIPKIIKGAQIGFLSGQKITNLQFLILVALSCCKECKMSQLARDMKMSFPQTTGIVDRLIKSGLIERAGLTGDRRVVLIKLSPEGQKLINRFKSMLRQRWQKIIMAMQDSEIDIFLRLLQNISSKIEKDNKNE